MGYWAIEEVMLPARFLATTAHLVAMLTILLDARPLAAAVLVAGGADAMALSSSALTAVSRQVSGLAAGALACFAVEYAGLFGGVSLFMHGHSVVYILLHALGAIITGLAYSRAWSTGMLLGCVLAFNATPAMLELATAAFVSRLSYVPL